jgi:hypothetical protein
VDTDLQDAKTQVSEEVDTATQTENLSSTLAKDFCVRYVIILNICGIGLRSVQRYEEERKENTFIFSVEVSLKEGSRAYNSTILPSSNITVRYVAVLW